MNISSNKRILILDDDQALLRSLQIILEDKGYEVLTFSNPVQGCDFIRNRAPLIDELPDIVLLDYAMPLLRGDEVLLLLHRVLESSCRIFLISAHTDIVSELDLDKLGVEAFFAKPLDMDQLLACLQKEKAA